MPRVRLIETPGLQQRLVYAFTGCVEIRFHILKKMLEVVPIIGKRGVPSRPSLLKKAHPRIVNLFVLLRSEQGYQLRCVYCIQIFASIILVVLM